MIVRPATIADAAAIADVHVLGWQQAYRGILPDDFLGTLDVGRRVAYWQQRLRDPAPDAYAFVAVDVEDAIVGFSSGSRYRLDHGDPVPDVDLTHLGEVAAIYVLADRWRAGLGTTLMDASLACMSTIGFTSAALWVLTANRRARAFYERGGWHHDGARKWAEFGGTRVEELRYQREVAPVAAADRPE